MYIKNHNKLHSCIPYILQSCNSDIEKRNYERNQHATTGLKALALQHLQSNRQRNCIATGTKNLCNFDATNDHQRLHEFIFKTYGITRLNLQKFLGEHWIDYAENPEALKLWAEIVSEKEVMINLKVLTREQYENLFN